MPFRHFLLLFAGTCALTASAAEGSPSSVEQRSAEELEELFAPIALYPDALVALILPAATVPSDVVLAARHLAATPAPESLDEKPWDDSVRGLGRYPEVIAWMDENLEWTKAAGEAFVDQPADVMNVIQRLRTQARAAGALTDTPQQRVVADSGTIRIVPARVDVIHVPRYDPAAVFVKRPVHYPRPYLTFGIGYRAGHWLAYDCDWRRHRLLLVHRHHRPRYWSETPDWRHRYRWHHRRPFGEHDRWHVWHPPGRPIHRPSFHQPPPSRRFSGHGTFSGRGDEHRVEKRFRRPGFREFHPDVLPSGPTPSMAAPITPVPDVRGTTARSSLRNTPWPNHSRFQSHDRGREREHRSHRFRTAERNHPPRLANSRDVSSSRPSMRAPGFSRERRSPSGRPERFSGTKPSSHRDHFSRRSASGGQGSHHEHRRASGD